MLQEGTEKVMETQNETLQCKDCRYEYRIEGIRYCGCPCMQTEDPDEIGDVFTAGIPTASNVYINHRLGQRKYCNCNCWDDTGFSLAEIALLKLTFLK